MERKFWDEEAEAVITGLHSYILSQPTEKLKGMLSQTEAGKEIVTRLNNYSLPIYYGIMATVNRKLAVDNSSKRNETVPNG